MANRSKQSAWEFFGEELKRIREAAPMTQDQLGRRVFVSGGYIGQFEQAIRKPQRIWRSESTRSYKPEVFSSGCGGS
ncbi:hypothetical protein GCM10014713_47540 [Streptomyces purpureus]|uniref:HTH cro/C1-type domain-containing protein n=1 Tax=Streptomyces purpureus TaxID=1951 RepID=A0A918LTQ8_9ACTN|nr:hypothetical protein GCM10014713_47540 [Streptomyces purpureus]